MPRVKRQRKQKRLTLFLLSVLGFLSLVKLYRTFVKGNVTAGQPSWVATSRKLLDQVVDCSWYQEYVKMHKETVAKLLRGETNVKVLVYECHPSTKLCGGLGDRLGGMASLFYASVVLNRAFIIDQTMPLPLNATLVPRADLNWDVSKLITQELSSVSVKLIDRYDLTKVSEIFSHDLDNVKVLRVSINRFFTGMALWSKFMCKNQWFFGLMHRKNKDCPHVSLETPGDTFAMAFNILFQPSLAVTRRVSEMSRSVFLNGKIIDFVAIHARLGGKVQQTTDTVSWEDPERDGFHDVTQFAECADEQARGLSTSASGQPSPFVVFSDSEKFKTLIAQENPRVRFAKDTYLFHIDRSKGDMSTVVRGTVDATAEFILLSQARCIVASYSTFSGAASSILGLREENPCFFHFRKCNSKNLDFWEQTEIGFDFRKCNNT